MPINTQSGQKQPDNLVEIFQAKRKLSKYLLAVMVFRTLSTTLLEIFFKNCLAPKVIVESIKDPDDNF